MKSLPLPSQPPVESLCPKVSLNLHNKVYMSGYSMKVVQEYELELIM